ncbi:MAG: heavy metal translocating P-type ATPase [Lachnospiraceae bacterium]
MKKSIDFLAGFPMTVVAGICLALSLILLLLKIEVPFDPSWATIVISGIPMVYLAFDRLIRQRWVSSALLITMAMIASIGIGETFAAGEVAFIMAIGAILEDRTVARAKKGLSQLIALAPSEGRKLTYQGTTVREEMIPAQQIRTGDLLRVLPGEKIPVDAEIIAGSTSVDQSIMTGESLPVEKQAGESVYCGTMNRFGSIDIKASKVGEDSSLQKLIHMVQEAEDKKAPMQRIVDQWAVWLVPIALLIALATFLIMWGTGTELMIALNRGVTVLVVFCPCALALATPTTIIAAIGQAAKHGVIIKSGDALESMGKVDTIVFDKTGTLTYGKLEVSDILLFTDTLDTTQLLTLAAAAEEKSEHPLAKAIVTHAREQKLLWPQTEQFTMEAGQGILAQLAGQQIMCGNEAYLRAKGIAIEPDVHARLEQLYEQGKAVVAVAVDGRCIGSIGLSDVLRDTAGTTIHSLQRIQITPILLTGDNAKAAAYFAEAAGIRNVYAQLLPAQKVQQIEKMQSEGHRVCMVGDGVNDAPALKTAQVGVAMGSMGSDIAVEAADIALMSDDISKIPYVKRLSESALRTIKGNITASMCINAVAIALSVLGVLTPVTGALVHNAGSVLVVLNAALLYDRKFTTG